MNSRNFFCLNYGAQFAAQMTHIKIWVPLMSRTKKDFDTNNTYCASTPATAAKRGRSHRMHDGREMNDRNAAELREAYGAMTRFNLYI
jgi:hypothetical protein